MNMRFIRVLKVVGLLLVLGASMNVNARLFGIGEDSWKEEVLLHDGSTLIIKRSQSYGGRHEIGQPPPIKEHTISFTLPVSRKTTKWVSEYGEDIGRTNFNLLAVHVLNGTPYIVASPNLCLSYNKWGRPNPPYVFFKYDGKEWQRVPFEQFPSEFKTINVALDIRGREVKDLGKKGFVTAEKVKELNAHSTIREFKTILREAYPGAGGGCEELIKYKGYWIMPNDPVARGMVDRKTK
jgi:hypothetical protein